MPTIAKEKLSGSTSGRGVKVVATATLGTTIHTAEAGSSNFDEVWIWAYNSHSADVKLTLEFGGVTDPNDLIEPTLASGDWELVVPGLVLNGGLVITAFASTANVIALFGFVNAVTA
jgi:hypothetical protein